MIVHSGGDVNAAWLRQPLQPRRHVDAVAIEIAALDDDIAEIDADAQDDARSPARPRWPR